MNIFSLQFLIPILLLSAIFFYLPGGVSRRWVLSLCNFVFVWLCIPNFQSMLVIASFLLTGYAMAVVLRKWPNRFVLAVYELVLVLAFMVFKKYEIIQPLLPQFLWSLPVVVIGLSYMLFRQIHFLVDVMQQQITDFTLISYVNYQFNLFGFLSGPIQRYQEFQESWQNMRPILPTAHDVTVAMLRISTGILKIYLSYLILGQIQLQWGWFENPPAITSATRSITVARFLELFYGYPIYLYFNFSGYCDVVIASAALVGMKMPENFDRPYLSRNMIDYWTRFHRSLGFWIRDYLFIPMYKSIVERWDRAGHILVFPCYFTAFVLAGVWHGSTRNFVVFGLLHGIGVSVVKAWEVFIIKQQGRKGLRQYLASRPIQIAAIALTLNFVSFTMLFFPYNLPRTLAVLHGFAQRII